jgi:hypothetical protein
MEAYDNESQLQEEIKLLHLPALEQTHTQLLRSFSLSTATDICNEIQITVWPNGYLTDDQIYTSECVR